MRLGSAVVALSLLMGSCGAAYALSEVHVDFQPAGATTASGYTAATNANRWDNGTQIDLGAGVQGGWTKAFTGSATNRGTAYPDLLIRDFVNWGSSAGPDTFKITGLQPGSYNLKIYATDTQFVDKQTSFAIDGNNDGINEVSINIQNNLGELNKTVPLTVSAAGILTITCDGIGGAMGSLNGFDLVAGVVDTTPPAAVTTLASTGQTTTSVTLRWTAPADDNGTGGQVASYDLRYATTSITDTNWASATPATGLPAPAAPGTQQTFTVTGLSAGTTYYFAIKSADYASPANVSPLSNVVSAATAAPDTTPPAAIADLSAAVTTATQVTLHWTAPADDSGKAASYDVRYSTATITDANWATAAQATGEPVPANPGQQETFVLGGLTAGTTYFVAVKSADASGNVSALSNVISAATQAPDTTPPAAVTTLAVTGQTYSSVSLRWTAPADDNGAGGAVASYDVRYSLSPITDANWASASQASGEPTPASPGQLESFTVTGLSASTTYYFALKSADSSGNTSALSNVVTGTTSAQSPQSEVHVDFQVAGCVTATGYTAVLNTNRWDNSTPANLGGGVQGGWTASFTGDNRDRGTADPLTRDFLTLTYGIAPQVFQMRGVLPGTYDLKLYAVDPSFADKATTFAIDGNNDGMADVTVTITSTAGETTKTAFVTVSMAGIVSIACSAATSGGGGVVNGFDLTPGVDTYPPAAVTNLTVVSTNSTQARLQWTAPADDYGNAGRVASYDVRYSTASISDGNWATALQASGEPAPADPGQTQTFTVGGLSPNTTYYFAIKSTDANNNISPLSNVPTGKTDVTDVTAPAAVTNLAVTLSSNHPPTLTWTAPGDDGNTGTAMAYSIRYSTSQITDDATFAAATEIAGVPAPKPAGSAESLPVTGLAPSTTYWFALKTADETPNWSALSNVVQATTLPPDVTPPAAITNLTISKIDARSIELTWTAPGDDANTGQASQYDIRYATTAIASNADFAAATQVTGVPAPQMAGVTEKFVVTGLAQHHVLVRDQDLG